MAWREKLGFLAPPSREVLRHDAQRLGRRWSALGRWLSRHYVAIVFGGATLILLWAAVIGLWRVPGVVNKLLDELVTSVREDNTTATRSVITAMAAVLAAIAIFGTIVVGAIRVWTSERQTRTIEQGHVTDRLTRAIEQLGAEKTAKRVLKARRRRLPEGQRPVVVETTVPNLEVRLGAIYALERIAQDSERDHITIMEILCAYVRENAKAKDAATSPVGDLADRAGEPLDDRQRALEERHQVIRSWLGSLAAPRVDIQAALTVLGRRSSDRIAAEQAAGFRLDLRDTNLRRANLRAAGLERANLIGGRLEGADLIGARLERADLSGARLERADLRAAGLERADLIGARLERANLRGARLERADLSGARLEGADLRAAGLERADLRGARLEGANLSRAGLEGADLSGARLEGANLSRAGLERADLSGARLEGADLRRAGLEGANLSRARLEGANLSRAGLEGADLSGARLEGADLSGAGLERADLSGARLEWADLREARLEGADLRRAGLEGADLREARLEGADLRQAGLERADLRGADFRKSNWAGASNRASPAQFADFRGAQGLTQAQLEDLIGNEGTLLPDGPSDAGEPWYVWSCWETPPPDLDGFVAAALRAEFLCGLDNPRRKTGTPLALDAPYPEGHPLSLRVGDG